MISIPFIGSKRNYVRPVEELVSLHRYNKVFEPFGGSAVLSVTSITFSISILAI